MALTKARTVQYPVVATIDIDFTATNPGTLADAIASLPDGAEVVGGSIVVDTAWVGPTTATLSVGDSGSATRYASAVNLKATGRTALTLTGYKTVGATDVLGTVSAFSTDATAGAARVSIEYIRHGKANEVQV